MDLKYFTKEQMALIDKEVEENENCLRETISNLLETAVPTPLKSEEEQQRENKGKIEMWMDVIKKNTEEGTELFIKESQESEMFRVGEIFGKIESTFNEITGIGKANPVTEKDCEFLEEMAKRRLIRQEYQEASCMFRMIIQLNGFFSEGWVGWAISEQELGHFEVVDQIYQMATELLPKDYYIILFAVDFYTCLNQREKAKNLLEKSKAQLLSDGMQNSKSFEAISLALDSLQNNQ